MSTRRTFTKANSTTQQRLARGVERDPGGAILKGTGIAFTSSTGITDSGNGLAKFAVGQRIVVRGSPKNSRVFTVTSSAAGALAVLPGVVTAEDAGAAITIALAE